MKKIILTLVAGLLLQLSYAQEKAEMPACLIASAGLNLASLNKTDYVFYSESNPGFCTSAMIRSRGDFYCLTGFEYIIANPTMASKLISYPEPEKVQLQILQLPIMIGYQVLKSDDLARTLRGQLGVSFQSLLSVSDNSLGIEKENLHSTGVTFRFGIGADLWMFVADVDYNLLLSHLYDATGYNNKAKFMCWEFSLGIKINLDKMEVWETE